MPIISTSFNDIGNAGQVPSIVRIETDDSLATVLTAGYLNVLTHQNLPLSENSLALVSTGTGANKAVTAMRMVYSGGDWSLAIMEGYEASGGGGIVLPTTANHIAVFTDAAGTLSEDPTTAISDGSINATVDLIAGKLDGTSAGGVTIYPAAAASGYLGISALPAVNGDFGSLIKNNPNITQTRSYLLPNPVTNPEVNIAAYDGALAPGAGNIAVYGSNIGLLVDGGAPGLQAVTVNLSEAQVRGMYAAPVLALAAPSATSMHVVSAAIFELEYGSVVFADGGNIWIQYSSVGSDSGESGGNSSAANNLGASYITAASNLVSSVTGPLIDSSAFNPIGQPLYISNQDAAFTGGTGSVVRVHILYTTISGTF